MAQSTGNRGKGLFLALALGLLAMLPYVHGIDSEFITFDDPEYVYENANVHNGLTWKGIGWALTTFHWGNWHPLTWLSHMLDVSLFGLEPWGHHLASVLLHGLNTTLLFLALFRLTTSLWSSAMVAALFGVHPLHVESVAWVAERKDLLAGLFFMLVLLAYERYARRGRAARLLAVTLLLALGLMAKAMLVTVPFVLLLLDVWPLGRTAWAVPADGSQWSPVPWGKLLLEKTPLFVLSFSASVIAYLAQQGAAAVASLDAISPGIRAAHAVTSYASYLRTMVWPAGLAVLYPHPLRYPSLVALLGSILLLGAVSCVVFSRIRQAPFLAVGWLWYLGMLVPVIGLVQVGSQAMADRYTYLPLLGVFIAIAWGVPHALPQSRNRAVLLPAVSGTVVLLLSCASWVQVELWKDSTTLFERTLEVTSDNWIIENDLACALLDRGMTEEAIPHVLEALRLRPEFPGAHFSMGNILQRKGRTAEALVEYQKGVRLQRR